MLGEYFKIAIGNLLHRKMRSWLTMIGIFIGIAAVVALISLGQGLQSAIEKEFEAMGSDTLIIQPRNQFGPPGSRIPNPLTVDDLEEVEKTKGVVLAAPMLFGNGEIEFNDKIGYYYVMGLPTDDREKLDFIIGASNYDVDMGRQLKKGDKYKAVLGIHYRIKNLFDKKVSINDKILVNGKEFEVIGFWESIGNPNDDRAVTIPEDAFREIYNEYERVDYIFARVSAGSNPSEVADEAEKNLRKFRNEEEGDETFIVQTPEELLKTYGTILTVVQAVLVGIAAISLVVGAVGIMNTMYTAVLERTKEIGIMKSIGAKNSAIQAIFLIESGLLGLAGGIIGVIIGIGLSKSVQFIAYQAWGTRLLSAAVPLWLVLGALAFSFLLGMLSGFLPARHASLQNPVDSLQYEK
ncbi:MAG: ABC transporter permease [Candidatus Woesearchaeota archaeon]